MACTICRAQEMSRYVENGTIDAGLTGKDWIEENESDVVVVDDLIYSKASQSPARWVLAVPADSDITRLEQLEGKKIATELVHFTKRYFEQHNIHVEVEFSWGATEAKVVSGLADAIVEVTETGSTIKAHGLKIIHELMESNTQLIANRTSYEDEWKRSKIEQIALLLKGALRAENLVGLKMNVPVRKMESVIQNPAEPQCPDGGRPLQLELGLRGNRGEFRGGAGPHSTAHSGRRGGHHRVRSQQGDMMRRPLGSTVAVWLTLAALSGCAQDQAVSKKKAEAKQSLGLTLIQDGQLEAGLNELIAGGEAGSGKRGDPKHHRPGLSRHGKHRRRPFVIFRRPWR